MIRCNFLKEVIDSRRAPSMLPGHPLEGLILNLPVINCKIKFQTIWIMANVLFCSISNKNSNFYGGQVLQYGKNTMKSNSSFNF